MHAALQTLEARHLPILPAAGEGATHRWLSPPLADSFDLWVESIPFDETRGYTKRVLASFLVYSWLYGEGDLAVSLGLAMAGIGFSVMHDGGHGAYSRHGWVNRVSAGVLDAVEVPVLAAGGVTSARATTARITREGWLKLRRRCSAHSSNWRRARYGRPCRTKRSISARWSAADRQGRAAAASAIVSPPK